jgi:hypothetical protein
MIYLSIETEAGNAVALGRLLERFGCSVLECGREQVRVAFPDASTESEAMAEARLYLSLRPRTTRIREPFRLVVAPAA